MLRWALVIGIASLLVGCAPKDQEECRTSAAKSARNQASLQVLLEQCERDFPARRRDDGSYVYYDRESATWVDVSGPKLSASDIEIIRGVREKKNQDIAEKSHAMDKLNIVKYDIKCGMNDEYTPCYDKNITVSLKNMSSRKIGGLHFEYEIGRNLDCSGSLGKSFYSSISIAPGQSGSLVQNFKFDAAGPAGIMTGCVRITSANSVE